jgi:hypothetical protein
VAALIATGSIVAATAGGSTHPRAPTASGPTTTITTRDLVQTDDQPGTLGYGSTRTTYSQLGGTVTWLPTPGDVIRPDHRAVLARRGAGHADERQLPDVSRTV